MLGMEGSDGKDTIMRTFGKIIRTLALGVGVTVASAAVVAASTVGAAVTVNAVLTATVGHVQHVAGHAGGMTAAMAQAAAEGLASTGIDPTVSYAYTAAPVGVDCGAWRYGLVTVHGVREVSEAGCIDPAAPLADGFVGLLPGMMRDASQR